jgi:hypothetical protein
MENVHNKGQEEACDRRLEKDFVKQQQVSPA